MLAVGAHLSGRICCCPFERMYDTFSDYWLWVVVFYALYLMVPLLEWHFCFAWCGFAAKTVYTRGTKSQSHGQCVDKASHILIGLSGCWGWGGCPLGSHPPPGCVGVGGGSDCLLGSHPPPLRKVTSQSSTSRSLFPTGFPQGVGGAPLGGAFSSLRVASLQRSSMSCCNSSSTRFPRFTCNWHRVLPPRWQLWGECWGFPFPIWGWMLCTSRFPIHYHHIGPLMGAEGWEVLILITSSCKAIALTTSHAMNSMSSAEWNNMTDSIAKYLTTPLGCVCPNQTQISMMSSSCMEAASNRVQSPLVRTKMHVWLREVYIITWNSVSICQGSCCGCGRHYGGERLNLQRVIHFTLKYPLAILQDKMKSADV